MGLADWLRMILLSLVWGSSFYFVEIALQANGPLTIVLVRVFLAALALILYCRATGIRVVPTRGMLGAFIVMGILANVLPFTLIAYGQIRITSSLSAIFIAATPLFTVLLGHFWSRAEPATPGKVAGVVTGLVGVAILMGFDALAKVSTSTEGQLAMLAAALFYGISAVYGRRFSDVPPAATAAAMLTVSSVIMAPLAFLLETPFIPFPDMPALMAMVALALASTALAYILYFTILANAGATNAMLVTLVQPPVAIVLGVTLLDESLAPHQLGGLAVILAGLVLVDGRLARVTAKRVRQRSA